MEKKESKKKDPSFFKKILFKQKKIISNLKNTILESKIIIALLIILIIFIIYVYNIQYKLPFYDKAVILPNNKYFLVSNHNNICTEDFKKMHKLKTGDMLLFKAYNNFNSIFTGSYYGHVGLIYKNCIFEAAAVKNQVLFSDFSHKGIYCTPIYPRIIKYPGKIYVKRLKNNLSNLQISSFANFIRYALKNMEYDHNVVQNGIKKLLKLKYMDKNTDCGQIVFLSLISMGLIDFNEYFKPELHHLKRVTNISKLQSDNEYEEAVELIYMPYFL